MHVEVQGDKTARKNSRLTGAPAQQRFPKRIQPLLQRRSVQPAGNEVRHGAAALRCPGQPGLVGEHEHVPKGRAAVLAHSAQSVVGAGARGNVRKVRNRTQGTLLSGSQRVSRRHRALAAHHRQPPAAPLRLGMERSQDCSCQPSQSIGPAGTREADVTMPAQMAWRRCQPYPLLGDSSTPLPKTNREGRRAADCKVPTAMENSWDPLGVIMSD